MARHYIVTCGASQIEAGRVESFCRDRYLLARIAVTRENVEKIRKDRAVLLAEQAETHGVVEALVQRWPDLPDLIGNAGNPFGAEVSTLCAMHKEGKFDPAEARLTLLHSDTESGAFCAAVLGKLLVHHGTWGLAPDSVQYQHVPGLRDCPVSPDEAERNLARLLKQIVRPETCGVVMTGGYKASIPIVTVFALLNSLELYYLFETSPLLRTVRLPALVPKGPKWVAATLQRIGGENMAGWLEVLLPEEYVEPDYEGRALNG